MVAGALLQESTTIWLNDELTYGPVNKPIVGKGCCYHPRDGSAWLSRSGLSISKASGIEIYRAKDLFSDRSLWGVGGVLVHELSHAYHDKFCKEGYDNTEVAQAYQSAMVQGKYNCVSVHGSQGKNGPVKAYACANRMEFFAELSVAFMWKDDPVTEYNKWFPFNCSQLAEHDPATLRVLEKLWNEPYLVS